jgi:2-polyprenyl-3-methyl-5-hydroxy-6-metoxy-1,4-benzoquinol methylase
VEATFSCRFCHATDIVELFPAQDTHDQMWFICQCNACHAYFLTPEPTEEQIRLAYDASYYGEGESKFGFSVEGFIDKFRRRRAKYLASLIPQKAKVLDIGCGNGRFLQHLSTVGDFELHGIEMEGGSAERAKRIKEINLKIGTLTAGDYTDGYFDAITLFHVFEHLDMPKETLQVIKNILKTDGILMMSFPNIASWQARAFKGKWLHLDPPRHLFFFAPNDFISIMDTLGFKLIRINRVSIEQNPYGWVQSLLNRMCKKRDVLFERLKGNTHYAPQYGGLNIFFQKIFFVSMLPFFVVFDLFESLFKKNGTFQFTFKKKSV